MMYHHEMSRRPFHGHRPAARPSKMSKKQANERSERLWAALGRSIDAGFDAVVSSRQRDIQQCLGASPNLFKHMVLSNLEGRLLTCADDLAAPLGDDAGRRGSRLTTLAIDAAHCALMGKIAAWEGLHQRAVFGMDARMEPESRALAENLFAALQGMIFQVQVLE